MPPHLIYIFDSFSYQLFSTPQHAWIHGLWYASCLPNIKKILTLNYDSFNNQQNILKIEYVCFTSYAVHKLLHFPYIER